MESATLAVPDQELVPITASQRIEALDVVRGFALLGIFLMNIEYFNRTLSSLDEGMPRGLTGIDWLASWFIAYFVQGKFWTIFSLLFGMGFAVMMTRAARASVASEPRERSGAEGVPASESVGGTGGAKPPGEEMTRAAQAGRAFKIVYLRRVLALAVFGAAHFVLLWEGDILFSYAVAALMLMIVLYGKTRPLLLGIAIAAGLAFHSRLGERRCAGFPPCGRRTSRDPSSQWKTGDDPPRRYSTVLVPAAIDRLAAHHRGSGALVVT